MDSRTTKRDEVQPALGTPRAVARSRGRVAVVVAGGGVAAGVVVGAGPAAPAGCGRLETHVFEAVALSVPTVAVIESVPRLAPV